MRIKRFTVKNYKSLKEVTIDNLSDLTVFVGPNDCGKSNILKAMEFFFNWVDSNEIKDSKASGSGGSIFQFEYQSRDMRICHKCEPCTIEMTAVLEIDQELTQFFPEVKIEVFEKARRPVAIYSRNYLSNQVSISSIISVEEGNIVKGDVKKIAWGTLYLLRETGSPDNMLHTKQDGGYTYVHHPDQTNIPQEFIESVRGKFVLIPALRGWDREERTTTAALPSGRGIPSDLMRLEKDTSVGKKDVFEKIQKDMTYMFPDYKNTSSMEEGPNLVDVYFDKYPSSNVGEGVKKFFMLCYGLESNPDCIFGIEEPEIHFHPEQQRQLYDFLADRSKTTQLFMTTHSPMIAARTPISNLHLVNIDGEKTTSVKRITKETVGEIIEELGIRQSDFFDSDVVTFVEGPADEQVFETFAERLHEDSRIPFIAMDGCQNVKYYATAKILTSRSVKIKPVAIFDKDIEKEDEHRKMIEELKKDFAIKDEDVIHLEKNSIEDYLLNPSAIKEAFPKLKADKHEIGQFINANSSKRNKKTVLDHLFRQYGLPKYRDTIHAKKIAEKIPLNEIDHDLQNILNKLIRRARK